MEHLVAATGTNLMLFIPLQVMVFDGEDFPEETERGAEGSRMVNATGNGDEIRRECTGQAKTEVEDTVERMWKLIGNAKDTSFEDGERKTRSIDLISSLERLSDARLPRDVTPSGYRLEIQPHLEGEEFYGHVTINITCQEDTDKITIHAHQELMISERDVAVIHLSAESSTSTTSTTTTTTETPVVAPVPVGAARLVPVSSSFVPENACVSASTCAAIPGNSNGSPGKVGKKNDGTEADTISDSYEEWIQAATLDPLFEEDSKVPVPTNVLSLTVSSTERQPDKDWYVIHLSDRLKRGERYQLDLKFAAVLPTDRKDGFFIESYTEKNSNLKRRVAATQMRPNHARRVFPCFDEPSFKVPFDISIAHNENTIAISNMPVRLTEPSPGQEGWVWDHFQRTPPMSTFSVSIVVTDLQSITVDTTMNNSLRIWGRKGMISPLQNALKIAPKALEEVSNYLAMPLPVPKLDIIALPGYTAIPDSNWGVIIFREGDLTTDELLVKHLTREITYQWIGNLVTPHWWSDVHINKALVNFIAHLISFKIDSDLIPNSELWTKNYPLYYEYGRNQPYKNLPSQKPPKTVTKTELILRMLNCTLSESTFQKSVQQLVGERQFKTFTQDDLWSSLTEQAGMDGTLPEPATVNQIAESWMKKERLPMVTVNRDYEKNTAEVTQEVFIRDLQHDDSLPREENFTWWIPLVIVHQYNLNFTNMKPCAWMKEEKRITLNNMPTSGYFVIVNPEEIGPFLVNYDDNNWSMISSYLEKYGITEQIPPATRAKLVHDSLNLAYSGKLSFDSALNVTRFLINEKDPIVWQPVFNMFDHLHRQIEGTRTLKKFHVYITVLLRDIYTNFGKSESKLTKSQERMYKLAKSALCNAGYDPCVKEARAQWKKWMEAEDPNSGIPIHQSNFCWVFKWGTRREWEFGFERYVNFPPSHKQADKYYLLKTLISCPNDAWNIERLLNYTLLYSNTSLTEGNTRFILSLLSSEVGYTALYNLLADNFDAIKRRYDTPESGMWDNIVSAATRNFRTQSGLAMVTELSVERQGEFGSAETVIEQSLTQIQEEVYWIERNLPTIDAWLNDYISSHGERVKYSFLN